VHSRLNCGDTQVIRPDYRIVATSFNEIEAFISAHGSAVLKSPLSGSGKGIRFVREELCESDKGWCRRTIDKQGSVIVEQRLQIIKECAMLFECHHEGIDFIGYSLFESKNGAYSRNILASNEDIEDIIAGYIPRDTLNAIREDLTSILGDTLVGHYEGFLGVDQMICHEISPVFIPVSEINLRMTMGLIARNQYEERGILK
jgi:formate-dependent phosphoribosylglycinamide formyltransferase (GAR transformylase)